MTREGGGWRIEWSHSAVEALRSLDRSRQRQVASRVEDLQRLGPPPGPTGPGEPSRTVDVPADEQVLRCIVHDAEYRVVVVTLAPREVPAGGAVGHLARRWFKRMTGGGIMEWTRQIRYAARSLRRSPGFTATAVLTLALGIGASVATFTVANGVLLSPLPYGDTDGIVTIWSQWSGFEKTWVSEPEYVNYYHENQTLDDVALYFTSSHTFTSAEDPELVGSAVVTANIFEVLGVQPMIGRTFTWQEGLDEVPVVMLGHDIFQRRFAGDRAVVGTDVLVNGSAFTVVGVLPPGFVLPVDYGSAAVSEVFFTGPVDREQPVQVPTNGGSHGYYSVARLRDGVTAAEARADLENVAGRLNAQGVYSESWGFRPLVFSVHDDIVGSARGTILLLLAACGFVLLIACANVANLLLSRSEARTRDVAVRRALGAGRAEVMRVLLLESLLLAAAGGALGLAAAVFGIDALLAIDPDAVPRSAEVTLDGAVLAFTLGASVVTAALFGWVPALRVARGGVASTLYTAGRGAGAAARGNRTQGVLVAVQMAMAVVLLAAAGLTMRTFVQLAGVDLGFETEEVLTARLTVPSASYPEYADVREFWTELLRRLEEIPGVASASATRLLPLDSQMGDSGFRPVGYVRQEGENTAAEWQYAAPGYIEAMGIPLLAGRTFDDADVAGARTVMLINETAAERYWPDRDPLGSLVDTFGGDTAVVVGVVGDIRHNSVTAGVRPRYYRSIHQLSGPGNVRRLTLTIVAEGRAEDLVTPLRTVVRSMDPTMPLSRIQTMDDVLRDALARPRFAMVLLGVFGAVALALAVVGIYGVLAYTVGRRTQEIGVRMALGAEPGEVVGMVVRQGMRMALLGVTAGTVAALGLTRFMAGMLYGVPPTDLVTFLVVPGAFAVVALLACWVPAARAATILPTEALRYD
ncbi:MAG: ABC transporter permease [Longimicrobiales bacterium]